MLDIIDAKLSELPSDIKIKYYVIAADYSVQGVSPNIKYSSPRWEIDCKDRPVICQMN